MKYNFNWSAISAGAPYVSISAISIAFNSISASLLGNPEKIIIGFDENNLVLGVKAYEGGDIKCFEFSSRVKNGWVRVGARPFVEYLQSLIKVDFSNTQRFIAEFDTETKILMVKFKKEAVENDENNNGNNSG